MAGKRIVIGGYMPALDLSGSPVSGAKLRFYDNETTNLASVYTSAALTVAHPNPVIADAAGQFPSIFADEDAVFSVEITDSEDRSISGLRNRDFIRPSVAFLDGVTAPVSDAVAEVIVEETIPLARAALGAADATYYQASGSATIIRSTADGIGIGAFPSCLLQVGPNSGISDPTVVIGRTITGSQAAFGHGFSDFTTFSGPSVGGGDYAYCSYDARIQVSGGTWDHIAGYQMDPQIAGAAVVNDGWGYLSAGDISGGAAVTSYAHFRADNMNGNIGTQYGYFVSTLAGLTQTYAFYAASDDNPSRFGRVGILTTAPATQALDINAPTGAPCAVAYRIGMTAYAFTGVPRAGGDIVGDSVANDFAVRVNGGSYRISTNSGGSTGLEILGGNAGVRLNAGPTWKSGTGSPEGVVTASVGSFYSRTDGGAATSFYVKESGSGNTGWVAK